LEEELSHPASSLGIVIIMIFTVGRRMKRTAALPNYSGKIFEKDKRSFSLLARKFQPQVSADFRVFRPYGLLAI